MRNLEILSLRCELASQLVMLSIQKLALSEIKAGFREDQPRGSDGRWIIGGGRYIVTQRHFTGIKIIDDTTDKITSVIDKVLESLGPGKGALYGTIFHARTAELLRSEDIPGIGKDGVEQSFSFGDLVTYGLNGSVRTDVIQRDPPTGEIIAVWDIKTGNTGLNPKRVTEIRQNLNIGDEIPVIEVHINLGIKVKSCERPNISPQKLETGD